MVIRPSHIKRGNLAPLAMHYRQASSRITRRENTMRRASAVLLALSVIPFGTAVAQDFAQVRTLSGTVAESLKQSGRKTVAVVDFTDLQGSVTELGRFLAEEFSVALASTQSGIETVDRTHLRAILAENKLSTAGLIDAQTARKLGQITGVDTLLTGTLTPFGDTVRLTLKLIDSTTARVVSASTADIPRTKGIDELLGRSLSSPGPLSASQPGRAVPAATASHAAQQSSSGQKIDAHGIAFTLDGCKRMSGVVVCVLRVVNVGDDRQITLVGKGYGNSSRDIVKCCGSAA